MSVTITDKEPKAEEKIAESLSRRGSVDAAVSCFEQPTLGQALRDGKPGDIDYVNSFLHLLAQQQKLRKEQQAHPQAPTAAGGDDASSDDDSESDDDDYRRRRGWKKRKLIWKDTYPPLKKGVRKKNRYKRRRSKEANTMQHTILQTLQTSGVAGPLPLQTSNEGPTTPERLRESSMPDVRDMLSPTVIAAMESQQHQQTPQQSQQPAPAQQQQHQHQGQHGSSSTPSSYVVPIPVASAPLHPMSANASMAMHGTVKRDFDDFAFIEQSLLVHPPAAPRCSEQQQIAEEIMAEGRHGQLPAVMNPQLNAALLQHPMPPHAQHPMWQRAIHALPDNVALTDEQVDEFYGQRLWATFEDIFDTEAMAGIEESLQTASIQAHIPTLAAGAASLGFGNGKTASTNQIWEEFFNE